ncbi:MAG: hypothetical protein AB202_02535 [Parcubacteria bacterium C7867-007]|nr:MAG: hypothetical protein AB202_02535 [Parcubacteria bacterium C7867-007]
MKQHERRLASVVFVGGFVGDLLTFTLIDLSLANLVFITYLTLAAVSTFLAHTVSSRFDTDDALWRRIVSVLAPLAAQYAIGALLSGILIFYTKSATLGVSWPFLLLLALVFIGNEFFRGYRAHLAFQTVLFFFTLYAYAIFALPLALGTLGPVTFLQSTALAVLAFAAFLGLLAWIGWQRFAKTFHMIVGGSILVLVVLVGSYFTSLIPPIPLTLRDSGIYYSVKHIQGGYEVLAESERQWWELYKTQIIHHVPGTPLFAFSSVFAPGSFTAKVSHVWERYDENTKKWIRQSMITFPLSGGREGGYRGYSEVSNVQPGAWRVSIKTISGQTIGRIRFDVENVGTAPTLHTETR